MCCRVLDLYSGTIRKTADGACRMGLMIFGRLVSGALASAVHAISQQPRPIARNVNQGS